MTISPARVRQTGLYVRKRRAYKYTTVHRLESQRDLCAYLRHRGNLHMHYRRIGDGFSWVLMYESRSVLCGTDSCTMIPLTIA